MVFRMRLLVLNQKYYHHLEQLKIFFIILLLVMKVVFFRFIFLHYKILKHNYSKQFFLIEFLSSKYGNQKFLI